MKHFVKPLIAASFLAVSAPVFALTGSQSVMKETIVTQADGTQRTVLEPADLVVPGEKVVYQLNYSNDETKSASNLVLVMPIPEVVTYIDGSADSTGTQVSYSVDDGRSFGSRSTLTVVDADGSIRTASASDITHIRWTIPGPVAPGASGSLAFKGTLK